jgi:hypothetical protein
MNTETPRTDEWEIDLDNLPLAAALSFADEGSTTGGLLTHAALKTLAAGCRELNAARAEIERLDTAGIHSCHKDCQRPNCVLRRELKAVTEQRDEARYFAEGYRNRSWRPEDNVDANLLPWETTNPNEL